MKNEELTLKSFGFLGLNWAEFVAITHHFEFNKIKSRRDLNRHS